MSTANTAIRELTIDELSTVSGAAEKLHVLEFKMGLVKFQIDLLHGGGVLWNGNDDIEIPK